MALWTWILVGLAGAVVGGILVYIGFLYWAYRQFSDL